MRDQFETSTVLSAYEYMQIARREKDLGLHKERLQTLIEGTDAHPNDARLWHELAKQHRQSYNNDQGAMEAFETALRLAPNDTFIIMDTAKFKATKRQFDDAEQLYLKIYRAQRNDVKVLTALGNLYQVKGDMDCAAACFGKAVEIKPADDYARQRYNEVAQSYHTTYTAERWSKFENRVDPQAPAYASSDPANKPQPWI